MNNKILFVLINFVLLSLHSAAQEDSKLYFTTGIGAIKVKHSLRGILKPSVAFNSGIEFQNKQHWFLQGTVDFNTLKYDQMVKDEHSPYLFQNTNSSLLMLGVNGGKNFILTKRSFVSAYLGGGYLNIGEPRVTINNSVVKQQIARQGAVFGRLGTRIATKSPIKFLQTVYLDADWWTSPAKVQNSKLNGFAFYVGSRMSM